MDKDGLGVVVVADQNVLIATTRNGRIMSSEVRVSGIGMLRVQNNKVEFIGLGFSRG